MSLPLPHTTEPRHATSSVTPSPANQAATLAVTAVVMPALNEAESIGGVLTSLQELGIGQIIVGDNGSTDGTPEIVRQHAATVVHVPCRGYGAACFAAMAMVRPEMEFVAFMDADGADDATALPTLVAPIADDRADLVIGCRTGALAEPGALTLPQRFGNRLATTLIRLRWSYAYRDLGPFRVVRRTSLERLHMQDRAFGWTIEMQIRALQDGLRIRQIDVAARCRRGGTSKISGSVIGSIRAGWWILSTFARHAFHSERT